MYNMERKEVQRKRIYLSLGVLPKDQIQLAMICGVLKAMGVLVELGHYSSDDKNEQPNFLDSGVQFLAEDMLEKHGYRTDPEAIRIITNDVIAGGNLSLKEYIEQDILEVLDDRKIELREFKVKEE